LAGGAVLLALTGYAAEQAASNAPPSEVLLLDRLGRVVTVPTNQMPSGLRPPTARALNQQVPEPLQGENQPAAVQQRSREAEVGPRLFPGSPPALSPYLASQDERGNTAARPGPLFSVFPFEPIVQGGKYWLSDIGIRYSLQQTATYVSMSDIMQGNSSLAYYTLDFKSVWAIYDSPASGTAGWITSQVDAKTGLDEAGRTQDARRNLGSITDPTGIWSSVNGVRVPTLAWQQSLAEGRFVAIAGMVNQGNYIDQNAYAQSGRGQFINSALINSLVMPLPSYNFGLNLQWQPVSEWYAMLGAAVGNNNAGFAPWTDFNLETLTLLGEFGYAPLDVLGLGPGIYRIEPFVGKVSGLESVTVTTPGGSATLSSRTNTVEAGLCFNLQQKLGPRSPFGWFGRFGFGGEEVSNGAAAQIGTGFVVQGPFKHLLLDRTSNDILGVGFVWSQPSATTKTIYQHNEYVLEAFYGLQFSPTVTLKPDFQYVINPAFNPIHNDAKVFQLQLELAW
jgi:porin